MQKASFGHELRLRQFVLMPSGAISLRASYGEGLYFSQGAAGIYFENTLTGVSDMLASLRSPGGLKASPGGLLHQGFL